MNGDILIATSYDWLILYFQNYQLLKNAHEKKMPFLHQSSLLKPCVDCPLFLKCLNLLDMLVLSITSIRYQYSVLAAGVFRHKINISRTETRFEEAFTYLLMFKIHQRIILKSVQGIRKISSMKYMLLLCNMKILGTVKLASRL